MGKKDEYQFDYHEHDTFDEYRTGLRQVFEAVRYAEDKKKLKEVMEENREAYSRIDSDTRNMLEVVANVRIPEAFKIVEEGEERYDMCKAFEDMKLEGIEIGMKQGMEQGMEQGMKQGIEKGIRILIQAYQELGMPRDVITEKCAEKYEITQETAREYVEESCG